MLFFLFTYACVGLLMLRPFPRLSFLLSPSFTLRGRSRRDLVTHVSFNIWTYIIIEGTIRTFFCTPWTLGNRLFLLPCIKLQPGARGIRVIGKLNLDHVRFGSRRDSNALPSTTFLKIAEYGVYGPSVANIAAKFPTLSSPTTDTTPARSPLSARTPTYKPCR